MAGSTLQFLLLINYGLLVSRGYRYDPHPVYEEEENREYSHAFHGPQPISRIDRYDGPSDAQRTGQGTHQRSIPFTSDVQRVQELERRRLKSQGTETARAESGTYKIVNHPKPNLTSRRGPGVTKAPDNVLFPGPTQGPQSHRAPLVPVNIPEKCQLEGICEDVPDYPQELVDQLLSKIDNSSVRFNVDELVSPEITQRIGGPEEIELCTFKEKLIVPRAAPDRNGKWYYIANNKEKPTQAFRVEICHETQRACSDYAEIASGYTAYCKQKHSLRRMVAIGPNNEFHEDSFSIPSCCSCVLKPAMYPIQPDY